MPSLQTKKHKNVVSRSSLKKKFREKLLKSRSAEPYTNINAEKIGEGGYGVVSRPPARCGYFFSNNTNNINNNKNTNQNWDSIVFQESYYKNPNYISKLSEYTDALTELTIGNIVKDYIKNWKKYYCFTEFICGAPENKRIRSGLNDYQDTYGIAPYCGITLNKIISGEYHIIDKEACCLMNALKELCIGLDKLHSILIYHNDIHDENVLFNPSDFKLRWIDFGLAKDFNEITKETGSNWKYHIIFIKAELEDTENLIFNIIEPTLQFIKQVLSNSAKTKLNKQCFKDVEYYLDKIPLKYDEYFTLNTNNTKEYDFTRLVRNKYVQFIREFIKGYDKTKKCEYLTKNI